MKLLLTLVFGVLSFFYFNSSISLFCGLIVSLIPGKIFKVASLKKITKKFLTFSIVGLGFGMNIRNVIEAGTTGFSISLITIFGVLMLGILLGRRLKQNSVTTTLISVGTAVCGASAIVAISPAIKAKDYQIAVSLGVVFILNALALFIFPLIGFKLQMNDQAFGLWAAIAIHDTSSVVGAASVFSDRALEVAVPIKLVRALWIIPLVWLFVFIQQKSNISSDKEKLNNTFPWFIFFFLLTSLAGTFVESLSETKLVLYDISRRGLSLTLFMIGLGLSLDSLRKVGYIVVLHSFILWLIVSTVSLIWVQYYH